VEVAYVQDVCAEYVKRCQTAFVTCKDTAGHEDIPEDDGTQLLCCRIPQNLITKYLSLFILTPTTLCSHVCHLICFFMFILCILIK
jgi:hypothetical protein